MLETIWFVLWGLLWGIYFMLDGFDLGAGTLLPFIAKNEEEKRLVYQVHGALLGRQRGVADHRRRGDLRGLPHRLRGDVQLPVLGPDAGAVRPDHPGGGPGVPQQA